MYQARSLIGSDASGLSDPFARVICGEFSNSTQVIDETLSPTWDELLLFDDILIYGTDEEIKKDPPSIVVELFDQDKVVCRDREFLRCTQVLLHLFVAIHFSIKHAKKIFVQATIVLFSSFSDSLFTESFSIYGHITLHGGSALTVCIRYTTFIRKTYASTLYFFSIDL